VQRSGRENAEENPDMEDKMAQRPTLKVEKREDFGKGFARRARANNLIPAVIYGHGQEPQHVFLPYHDTFLIVKDDKNAVIALEGLGAKTLVLVKDIQRHPLKRNIMHIDLLLVKADEKVNVEVPIILVGEPAAGMVAAHDLLNIEVSVPVIEIPEHIEVSVEGLEEGTVLKVADLDLGKDVEAVTDAETVVVAVAAPAEVDLPEGEAPAEAEEAAAKADQAAE
jgi:ribosomal protein L25, ctc-form